MALQQSCLSLIASEMEKFQRKTGHNPNSMLLPLWIYKKLNIENNIKSILGVKFIVTDSIISPYMFDECEL